MVEFKRICLKGELGKKRFVLRNGQETKTFYNAGNFDYTIGQFPIYDENDQVVEYMDLMGTFSKNNTNMAIRLYYYMLAENYFPYYNMVFCEGILNFPSKYFTNTEVQDFIIEEELIRDELMKNNNVSLVNRLRYRRMVSQCLKQKIKKAYIKQQREEKEINKQL